MKNLKKILALVLAFACAFTMFAGAAFTDSADIKVKSEVVDTLVELGVIEGFEDGSFQPNATVTRAQMAKMIYVLRTGNSDASAYNDDKTSFTDIGSHWARGYIKYCQSLGIIAGKSSTIFAPNANVTAQEAAKMLLVTLGYDAQKAGLTGAGWASKTNALADEAGLLEDVNTSFTAACPRQYAAQLIYNAIDTPTVVWRDDAYTNVTLLGDDNKTIGEKYMSLKKTVATLTEVTKTSGKDTYELTLDSDTINENDSTDGAKAICKFTDVAKDYSSLKYKTVTVLHKDRKTVYGVYATDDNTQQTGILKDLKLDSAKKVKLDDTKYDLADTTTVYVNGDVLYTADSGKTFTTTYEKDKTVKATIQQFVTAYGDDADAKYTVAAYMQPTAVKLLATDGTTKYSILEVTTYAVGKVTSVGSDYVNVSFKKGDNSFTEAKCEDDDWDWYDGVKKDDYVVLTASGNYANKEGRIEKATVVSGKVTGTKGTPVNKVTVDGTVYEMAGKGDTMVKAPSLNSKVDLVVVNGYVYYVDTQSGSVDDVALLVEAGKANGIGNKWEARLIFADGSDKTVTVEKYWEDKDNKDNGDEDHDKNNEIGTIGEANGGILVTYEKSGDTYTLTKVGATKTYEQDKKDPEFETAGYDAYITAENGKTDGSIKGSTFIAKNENGEAITPNVSRLYYDANATVFVKYDGTADASYKVVTGKTASGYDKTITGAAALADKSGNSYYGKAVFLNMSNQKSTGGSSDKTYAVALSSQTKDSSSGSTLYTVKGWNGSEEITFKSEDSFSIKAGEIFEYSAAGNDLYDIDPVDTDKDYYVSQYDASSGDIALVASKKTGDNYAPEGTALDDTNDGNGNKINRTSIDSKDTVVLYVNSKKGVGVKAGEFDIDLAYYYDSDFWANNELTEDNAPNVRAYFDDDDFITVIVVDQNRNITEW